MNFEKAINLIENGEIETGLEQLELIGKQGTDDEKFNLVLYYQQLGLIDKSLALAEKLFELYPDESQILLTLGELYMELDREEEAIDILNDVKEDDPLYVQSLLVLADLYQLQGLDEVAEQKLLTAKKIFPDEPIIDFGLAEFYFFLEDYRKSAVYYETVLAEYENLNNVNISLRLAESLSGFGQWEEAIPYFEKGLAEGKEMHSMFQFANTLMHAGYPSRAITVLNELKELNREISGLYLLLAQAYEAEGRHDEGYQTIQEGIKIDEYNVDLLFALAKMEIIRQNTEGAERTLETALSFEPSFLEGTMLLSQLYGKQEKYEAVVQLLTDTMKNGNEEPSFHWDLATAKKELEMYDEALKEYEIAYTFFNTHTDFLEEFGYFLLEEGQRGRAISIFQDILAIDPTLTHIEEMLQNLEGE